MPMHFSQIATWVICIAVFILILWRPRGIPEFIWAVAGAVLLVISRLLSPQAAWSAVRSGASVYLFLTGMMLLAELARLHGVFDWLAALAMQWAHGSQKKLFLLIYCIGILVTSLLSNDATAVLLTPAVLAVVRRMKASPLPYLFACAFIANAASFVLPISNPANLVVFDDHLPSLGRWLQVFSLPSLLAIFTTLGLLYLLNRQDLRQPIQDDTPNTGLDSLGKRAAMGILLAAVALLVTSALGGPIGLATFAAGFVAMIFIARAQITLMIEALRAISWGVLPLVGGLFMLVRALEKAGALTLSVHGLQYFQQWPQIAGLTAASFSFGVLSNAINNLPMGLIGAGAVKAAQSSAAIHAAVLLGINLGPNLSVTGSLATILWLVALRREKISMTGWQFLKVGLIVMPPALLLAVLSLGLALTSHR